MLRILFIGDVVGKPARRAVAAILPALRQEHRPDVVIANAENLAHGKGVTRETLNELLVAGVDFFTSGNHIWSKPEGIELLTTSESVLLRPANYPQKNPGVGAKVIPVGTKSLLVINLMGTVNMHASVANPFLMLDEILASYRTQKIDAIFVDFHAEVTSEKNVFGLHADGKVSAVVGTHTHIPTADECVLPQGTAYIADVGMVGLKYSSLGIDYESMLQNFLTGMPAKHTISEHGRVVFNSVLIDIDTSTKKATSITRIQKEVDV